MKIITYRTELDEDRKNVLVQETSGYYSDVQATNSPEGLVKMVNAVFHAERLAEEHSYLIALDQKFHVIGVFDLSHGMATASLVGAREIFIRLCLCGATCFALAHNHPSGDPMPSKEDFVITKRLKECGDMMGLPMIDHIIIGNQRYYSCKENNTL